ncbi:MAG: cellulase family glycosylhydrolase [Defluviitaleaceae bacterium]|nr:cellulase family glycosylhydrolase [Defluviitaleaceae bacterium]
MKKAILIFALLLFLTAIPLSLAAAPEKGGTMRNMTSEQIVHDMGIGINLGNTFEATGNWIQGTTVRQYETAWGSPVITEALIRGYAEAGFGAVRIPVAWSNMMGENYTIHPDLMDRVEEVTQWVLRNDMYAIVNIHWDGGWWSAFPTEPEATMVRFERFWDQIAERFADYGDMLLFESANEELGWDSLWNPWGSDEGKEEAYALVNLINQTFVDLIRASGGNNSQRHLLIAGYHTDFERTVDPLFLMPNDPANRLIAKVHYYTPSTFALLYEDAPWGRMRMDWGSDADFAELNRLFDLVEHRFIDNGVPVILGEFGAIRSEYRYEGAVYRYIAAVTEAAFTRGMAPIIWCITISERAEQGLFFSRATNTMVNPDLEARFREIEQMPRNGNVTTTRGREIAPSPLAGAQAITPGTDQVPADAGPIPIETVEYFFIIEGGAEGAAEGVGNESGLEFQATSSGWQSRDHTIPAENGEYSFTFNFGGAASIYNLGFISTIEGSDVVATLKRIVVNGNEMQLNPENAFGIIYVGLEGYNGLHNRWNQNDGELIATGGGARLIARGPANYALILLESDGTVTAQPQEPHPPQDEQPTQDVLLPPDAQHVLVVEIGSYVITDLTGNMADILMDVAPIIEDGRTLIPLRFMAYALGAELDWDDDTREATLTLYGQSLVLPLGTITPELDALGMDVPPISVDGRTMVPLRFISEFFGAEVYWNNATNSASLKFTAP